MINSPSKPSFCLTLPPNNLQTKAFGVKSSVNIVKNHSQHKNFNPDKLRFKFNPYTLNMRNFESN